METLLRNPSTSPRGIFLAFEGGEGAGKSTQIARLSQTITHHDRCVTLTREPGGSAIGRHLRRLLLSPDTGSLHPRTEALMFAADRSEHVSTVIRPALEAGNVVITDRYMDSSAAYQGAGRGLERDEILSLSMWAADQLVPNLTIVLDVDPAIGLARVTRDEFGEADRIESEAIEFAHAVRQGFLDLAKSAPSRYLVLDASQSQDALSDQIRDSVLPLLCQSA